MQTNPEFYFQYFNSLYTDRVNVTADLAPSYSGLGRDRLNFIARGFRKLGVHCKPIVLLRDPVKRIKSAVRFNLAGKHYQESISTGETDFDRALEQYYLSEHCQLGTRYDILLEDVIHVFGKANLYVGIYENRFRRR